MLTLTISLQIVCKADHRKKAQQEAKEQII